MRLAGSVGVCPNRVLNGRDQYHCLLGPPRRAAAASATGRKGSSPTADEKIEVLTQTLNLCESKIADLQTDLDRQRKKQEEEHKSTSLKEID